MSDNIRVAIRLRPLIQKEINNGSKILWETKDDKTVCQIDPYMPYCFDRVFNYNESNAVVYRELCAPIVHSVMEGFHGTIFAYGQTSSGKTHTMLGGGGIIPSAIQDIFNAIEFMAEREFLVRVSYMEIYQEKVYDLLASESKNLKIQGDVDGIISVIGLTEEEIKTSQDVFKILQAGETKRRVAETQMNEHSSRSHAIFRMIVESRLRDTDIDGAVNVAQLNLVDLAGSERTGQMGEKERKFREGTGINKSLSHLSLVIRQLSEGDRRHVSYRNSCLTRILQNSLGGNAHTLIICTVTPVHLEPTQSTLNFASQAKTIKNKPTANVVWTDQALLKKYANKIRNLSEKLQTMQQNVNDGKKEILEKELQEKEKQNEMLKQQIEQLKQKFIVSQSSEPTVNLMKKIRRETVCFGALSLKNRLRNQQENSISFFNPLPSLQEEASIDSCLETEFLRRRTSSTEFSTSCRSSLSDKILSDASVQTEREDFIAYKKLSSKLKILSRQLGYMSLHNINLEKELKELREFTKYEKDISSNSTNVSTEIESLQRYNKNVEERLHKAENENTVLMLKINELEKQISSSDTFAVGIPSLNDTGKINEVSSEENSVFGSVSSCGISAVELCVSSPTDEGTPNSDREDGAPVWELLEEEVNKLIGITQGNSESIEKLICLSIAELEKSFSNDSCGDVLRKTSISSEDTHLSCKHKEEELEHSIAMANVKLASKEEAIKLLQTKCGEKEAELKDAMWYIEDLGKSLLDHLDKYNELESNFQKTHNEYLNTVQSAIILKEKVEEAFALLTIHQEKLSSLNETIYKYEMKVSKLQESIAFISSHQTEELEILKSEKQHYEKTIEALKIDKDHLTKEKDELKVKITKLEDVHHNKISDLEQEFAAQIENSDLEMRRLQEQQLSALETIFKNKYENEFHDLEVKYKNEIDALIRSHAIERLQIEESAARMNDNYENEMISVISNLKQTLDQKIKECEELQLKLREFIMYSSNSNLRTVDQMSMQLKTQEETISKLTNQCMEYSNKVQQCRLEYKKQVHDMENEIKGLKEQEKSKENTITELKNLLKNEQKKLGVTEQKYRTNLEKIEQHKKEFEEKIHHLKQQYRNFSKDDLQQKLKDSVTKITSLSSCLQEKENTLQQKTLIITELEQNMAKMVAEYKELKSNYDTTLQKIEILEKNVKPSCTAGNLGFFDHPGNENKESSDPLLCGKKKGRVMEVQDVVSSIEIGELRQKIKKLEEERVFLEKKLSMTRNELRRIQEQNNESKVEPKKVSKNKIENVPVAGSGAVNAFCIEQLESVVKSKDRRIRKLESELEMYRKTQEQNIKIRHKIMKSQDPDENKDPKHNIERQVIGEVRESIKSSIDDKEDAGNVRERLLGFSTKSEEKYTPKNRKDPLDVGECKQQ